MELPGLVRQPDGTPIEAMRALPGRSGWLIQHEQVWLIAYDGEGADRPYLALPDLSDDYRVAGAKAHYLTGAFHSARPTRTSGRAGDDVTRTTSGRAGGDVILTASGRAGGDVIRTGSGRAGGWGHSGQRGV